MKDQTSQAFTDEERAAIKERAHEVRSAKRRSGDKTDGESELLAKIAEMAEPDRVLAEGLHRVITASAPGLTPRLWYGMPAYAKDGKVLCFFQPATKFKSRYATLGFNDDANLDDGAIWPTAFALTEWTDDVEDKVGALVSRAVG